MTKVRYFGIFLMTFFVSVSYAETELEQLRREASENVGVPVHVYLNEIDGVEARTAIIEILNRYKQAQNFRGCVDGINVGDRYKAVKLDSSTDTIDMPASLSVYEINSAIKGNCITDWIKEWFPRAQAKLEVPMGMTNGAQAFCSRTDIVSTLMNLVVADVGDIKRCFSYVVLHEEFMGRDYQDVVRVKCGASINELESHFKKECK